MIKKTILTDVDGVLVSWNDGFMHFMAKEGYPMKSDKNHSYSVSERHGCEETLVYDYVAEYCKSETIANLQPIKNSVEVVKRLQSQGFDFIAITSLGTHEDSYKHRLKNLTDLYGDAFSKLICLPGKGSKKETLAQFVDIADVWVEDHAVNANDGVDLGLKSFLIDHPYNFYYENISRATRVNDWLDIEEWINERLDNKIYVPK